MTRFSERLNQIAASIKAEKTVPEKVIQQLHDLRIPVEDPFEVDVYNAGVGPLGNLYAYRFAMIQEYNPTTEVFSIVKPVIYDNGLSFLSAGSLVMLEESIPSGESGKAFIGGVHKISVQTSPAQDIDEGDAIGTDQNGLAIKLGPFTCVKVDGNSVYVRPY